MLVTCYEDTQDNLYCIDCKTYMDQREPDTALEPCDYTAEDLADIDGLPPCHGCADMLLAETRERHAQEYAYYSAKWNQARGDRDTFLRIV